MPSHTVILEAAMAEVLEALAHPLRIRILKALLQYSCCQCDLASRLGEHPVNISRHLAVLTRAGLVLITKQGTKTFPKVLYPEIGEVLEKTGSIVRKTASERAREARSLQVRTP